MCLDARLPVDTLYMVFEEDYRFFPEGQDPDGIDDYKKGVGGRESWRRRELAEEGVGGGGSWRMSSAWACPLVGQGSSTELGTRDPAAADVAAVTG